MEPKTKQFKYEARRRFYERIQQDYDMLRSKGYDRAMIIDIISDRYCISKGLIRTHINMYSVEDKAMNAIRTAFAEHK